MNHYQNHIIRTMGLPDRMKTKKKIGFPCQETWKQFLRPSFYLKFIKEEMGMKIKNKPISCMTCQHSKDFAPVIGEPICDNCRRLSNFAPKNYDVPLDNEPRPFGDMEAKRLVAEGEEIEKELTAPSGCAYCFLDYDPNSKRCYICSDGKAHRAEVEEEEWDGLLSTVEADAAVSKLALQDDGNLRTFETGATRDTAEGKLDYEGFFSPVVLRQYAKYMNMNRLQTDGNLRDSDNWQKGIPMPVYVKSGFRHFFEWWETHRCENFNGDRDMTIRLVAAVCGLMFNAQGFLHELLKIIDMVDFDGNEPTPEMKERRDAVTKLDERS